MPNGSKQWITRMPDFKVYYSVILPSYYALLYFCFSITDDCLYLLYIYIFPYVCLSALSTRFALNNQQWLTFQTFRLLVCLLQWIMKIWGGTRLYILWCNIFFVTLDIDIMWPKFPGKLDWESCEILHIQSLGLKTSLKFVVLLVRD